MATNFSIDMIDVIVDELFHLISLDTDNETQIITLIKHIPTTALTNIVNTITPHGFHEESMLMLAVWQLKVNVVQSLIDAGANVRYKNPQYQSASTYWNHHLITLNQTNMKKACQIAKILHNAGVNLYYPTVNPWSLTKRATHFHLLDLQITLKELGYIL